MASKVQIVNMALSVLGANEVSDLANENTKEANLVNTFWDQVVAEVMGDHTWDFARQWVSLAEDAAYTMIDEKYDYAYSLPTDWIRPVQDENQTNWARRGQHILSNESPLNVEYIKLVDDVSLYPISFRLALASKLRVYLATPLGKRISKNIDWLSIYLNVDLPEARRLDAQQSNPSTEDAVGWSPDNDSWVEAGS